MSLKILLPSKKIDIILNRLACQLIEKYPENAWEIVMGYDQQKFLSARVADSIGAYIRKNKNNSKVFSEKNRSF